MTLATLMRGEIEGFVDLLKFVSVVGVLFVTFWLASAWVNRNKK